MGRHDLMTGTPARFGVTTRLPPQGARRPWWATGETVIDIQLRIEAAAGAAVAQIADRYSISDETVRNALKR